MTSSSNGNVLKRGQGASSEVVRDINKRLVLNLLRIRQPISRADLARASGLQRSTISIIVEALVDDHWVIEGPTARLPRGRRPTILRLNEDRVIIGVDIRPTQMTVALSDVNGKFTHREITPTPADAGEGVAQLVGTVTRLQKLCGDKKIEGIGVSVPGRLHHDSGELAFAPNLPWIGMDIRTPLAKATGLEVELENAANACVLASVWFDHTESKDLVVLTVSEGLGAGVFANGQLVRGRTGMAGEFGHIPLDPQGPVCNCGSRGCWEVFASNRAALNSYAESKGEPACGTFPNLLTLAEQGNEVAVKALDKMARYLGRGMRMIVAGVDPEQILVIGELTRAWHRFGPTIEAEVKDQVLPGGMAPRITPVHEDGMARLRGTVALVLQKHFASA
jgi:predicted NBD/HSP70 family sugar kinase